MAAQYQETPGGAVVSGESSLTSVRADNAMRPSSPSTAQNFTDRQINKGLSAPGPFIHNCAVPDSQSKTLVLYDGVCGLCNGLIRFLLKRDDEDQFRFASLQSEFASALLKQYRINAVDLNTVYVIADFGLADQHLLARSDAILHLLTRLKGAWSLLRIGRLVPKSVRDFFYDLVVRNRYRIFGKYEVCLMPEPKYRSKFLNSTLGK